MQLTTIRLKKNEDKRILHGHLWVYSNEIDTQFTKLSSLSAGQLVDFEDSRGNWLGRGYINPHTLLCARILTKDRQEKIDLDFFVKKIQLALQVRENLFRKPFYRLIYGEGDFLPGLIVDRYGDLLVVQTTTAGMESLLEILLSALREVLKPSAIILRNDHSTRLMEGLAQYVKLAYGRAPEKCLVEENEVSCWIDPLAGQKTGWFYDHRENRRQLQRFVSGKKVLDVFSYVGGWAVQAAVYDAAEVWAIDSSASALKYCQENAELNKVAHKLKILQNDAFDQLKELIAADTRFDVIILDPPAFIKKRKDHAPGVAAYKRLNTLAMRLLTPGGYLISASCSHHLSTEELQQVINLSAVAAKKDLQILLRGQQGLDHPILPAIPETDYLKAFFCRVI